MTASPAARRRPSHPTSWTGSTSTRWTRASTSGRDPATPDPTRTRMRTRSGTLPSQENAGSAVVPRVPGRAGGHPQAGAGGGAGVRRPPPQARGRDHVGGALPRPRRDLRAPRGRRRGARVRPRRRVGAQRGGPARARGHQRRHTHHRRVPRRDPAPLPATPSVTWDPYLDLQSGLLRNRLGITDARQQRDVKAELTAAAICDLIRSTIPGAYDLAHLRAFHRQIFQDLYDWAGELRTVSIG